MQSGAGGKERAHRSDRHPIYQEKTGKNREKARYDQVEAKKKETLIWRIPLAPLFVGDVIRMLLVFAKSNMNYITQKKK